MKSTTIKAMLLMAMAFGASAAASAQTEVPATQIGALVFGNSEITLDNNEATEMVIPCYSRYNFAVSSNDWIKASVSGGQIRLSVDENPTAASRTALLTLRGAQGITSNINVIQPGWDIASNAQAAYNDQFVTVVRCKDAGGTKAQASDPLTNSYDGNTSTLYHSSYTPFDPNDATKWPILEWYFTAANAPATEAYDVESIIIVPRSEGGDNGKLGEITIEVGTYQEGSTTPTWTAITEGRIDLKKSSATATIAIPKELQKGLRGVRMTVHTGYCNSNAARCFASIAEIMFRKASEGDADAADKALFVDAVCSALKSGVTQADVNAMKSPFYKQLAQVMLNGQYDGTRLTSTHNAIKSPQTLAAEMQSPGKCYDQTAGVTGVALTPGKYAILVDGIPAAKGSVDMKLTYWHGHEQYQNEAGNNVSWNVQERSYVLYNGINVIDVPVPSRDAAHRVDGDQTGLVYINNFDDAAAAAGQKNPVSVHVVGGLYNGYLANWMTNAECQQILDHAIYPCIDLVGTKVHAVWQTNAIKQYAAGQYVRYMNVLDQLIVWEHRVLGLDKYNRIPENRTMTYVNYNYYMYQGGRGPTFMYNTQNRVCNPDNLMSGDSDAVWGLSHEWGHQHQMAPYFRWTGMAEVSNNIFSAYNVAHMGYPIATNPGRYPRNKWQDWVDNSGKTHRAHIHQIFLDDNYNRTITGPDPESGETKTANEGDNIVMALRTDAKKAAQEGRAFYWSNKLKQFAINQPLYPSKRFASSTTYAEEAQNVVNPRTALNAIEAYSSNNGELILGPYVNLMYYFGENGNPDLWPDVFESLRQNDYLHGSSVEKGKTEVDKYELLTSIFNGNKAVGCDVDKTAQFKEMFPNSCWTTEGYLPGTGVTLNWQQNSGPAIMNCIRKLSWLCGYNLWSYFEAYGVFTVCAIEQGDYGIQHYIMTDDMYDEFKADMDALETAGLIKPLTEEMRNAINNIKATEVSKPNIPNDRPITDADN